MLFVFKFGGSSLSSAKKIIDVAHFIKNSLTRKNLKLIIVVSAMGKTTNILDSLAFEISQNKSSKFYGPLITLGENISSNALALALESIGVSCECLTSKDVKIHAMGSPQKAIITHIDKETITNHLAQNKVVIVSGFQGVNTKNEILSLGRGGSDTTAVALGNAFNCPVKIFTDVNGFHSLNPNKYKSAKLLKKINIYNSIELSSLGAKVLDQRCLCLANQSKTSLCVGLSQSETKTKINYEPLEKYHIDGVSSKSNLVLIINNSKNKKLLYNIFKNSDSTLYYYQQINEKHKEVIITDKIPYLTKHELLKLKENCSISRCDLLFLTGSGLLLFKNFHQKVQDLIQGNKIAIKFMSLSETKLTIATKNRHSDTMEKVLAENFNLIKEK